MKKFEIFGNVWSIEITENKDDLIVEGKFCKGAIHYKDSRIFIYFDTSDKDRKRLLLHELSHAVLYETQIELKEKYTEEDLCEFVAKYGLYIIELYNNLIEYLTK